MASMDTITTRTFVAGADLRTSQFRFVDLNASGQVVLSSDNGRMVGVLLNDPNTGEAALVGVAGALKVVSSGVVTRGGDIGSAANGQVKNWVSGTVAGVAMETGAANQIMTIHFHPR